MQNHSTKLPIVFPTPLEKALLPERFWSKVRFMPNGCWEWIAGHYTSGYGQFRYDGKRVAHIISYEALVGAVPEGLELDHLCRNRPCVCPWHLEPVTHRENVLRGAGPQLLYALRTHCPNGHPYSDENTYRHPLIGRRCRVCARPKDKERHKAQRDEKKAKGLCANCHHPADTGILCSEHRAKRIARRRVLKHGSPLAIRRNQYAPIELTEKGRYD